MLSLPNDWEGPLAEINTSEELEAWLRKQPPEATVALAARAALRVLPFVQTAKGKGYMRDLFLPVFRATGVAWAAATYPARAMELEATAHAVQAATRAVRVVVGHTAAAVVEAACGAVGAADSTHRAATRRVDAIYAVCGAATRVANEGHFWSVVSIDATRIEKGAEASVIASLPLWPEGQTEQIQSLWQDMKAALRAAGDDWGVWIDWYDDRLAGRLRNEQRELAYVRIDSGLWEQGPAIVNAEIKRQIEALSTFKKDPRVSATRRPLFRGFFSYTHRDAEVDPHIVEAFSSELERRVDAKLVNAKFEIWRDKNKLKTGDYWDQTIEGSIETSHVFIVLLTPKWISSDYCRKEFEAFEKLEAARKSGGYVIPIYAREIEREAKFLEPEQRELLDRLKRIQYQQIIPKQFAKLSDHERIDLIESVADPIRDMLERLRG